MNGFNLSNIQDAKLGSTQVSALYYGSTKIWELIQRRNNYEKQYFTIEALEDSTRIDLGALGSSTYTTPEFTIQYSTNNGSTWTSYTLASRTNYSYNSLLTLNAGQKILIKSTNNKWGRNTGNNEWGTFCYYLGAGTGSIKIYGNINSLIKGDNFYKNYNLISVDSGSVFNQLFSSSSTRLARIKDVSNLFLPDYSVNSPDISTGENCSLYRKLFENCTSITKAPIIEIYHLKNGNGQNKYSNMFYGCTSLTDVSNVTIYAEKYTIGPKEFNSMFYGCTSLTEAPRIVCLNGAYIYSFISMFYGCTKMSYLEYANNNTITDTWFGSNSDNCWTANTTQLTQVKTTDTSSNGAYYKNNKTLVQSKIYNPTYFTIESLEDNNVISFVCGNTSTLNNRQWVVYINGVALLSVKTLSANSTITLGTLNKGDIMQITDRNYAYYPLGTNSTNSYFSTTGKFNVSGRIRSLCNDGLNSNSYNYVAPYCYYGLFQGSKVVDASRLIINGSTSIKFSSSSTNALYGMFYDCTLLEKAPISFTIESSYNNICGYMFYNCTSLYEGPEIFITTLDSATSFNSCFYGCENLEYVGLRYGSKTSSVTSFNAPSWLTGTNTDILTINTNIWDTVGNYSNVPSGTTLINNKFVIENP